VKAYRGVWGIVPSDRWDYAGVAIKFAMSAFLTYMLP
jgi:hypothetical protein